MKFELTFDVLYKTQATCSIEADNLEEAKEIAQKIAEDNSEVSHKIQDDWCEELDWDNRSLSVSDVQPMKGK